MFNETIHCLKMVNTVAWDDILFLSHPSSIQHNMPFPRPHLEAFESPLRVQMAELYLKERGLLHKMQTQRAPKAPIEMTLSVHSEYLVDSIRIMTDLGSGQLGEAAYASPELLRSALRAVGGAVRAAEAVYEGDAHHAFSLMRPPGHHASVSTAMGLCYFNNIAIAVRTLLAKERVDRVSIIDFDDHHGNGTADTFYADPNVQYISIHEYDYENYGTGHFSEIGHADAAGTNINIPFFDFSPDASYRSAFERIIQPAVQAFEPSIIAVSAGYDPHYADPVGNMDVDSSTFHFIGRVVSSLVRDVDAMGSFWVLEGGYNPFVIGPSIEASLCGLAGEELPALQDQVEREINELIAESNENILDNIVEMLSPFW
ncbi:hypothetical protein EU545_01295 [Candidatus Thorarchaeota archaeon]|nr:MAG: hypothetical protein EU545_01295 [Candidatus Thorarchaeota archaeon]